MPVNVKVTGQTEGLQIFQHAHLHNVVRRGKTRQNKCGPKGVRRRSGGMSQLPRLRPRSFIHTGRASRRLIRRRCNVQQKQQRAHSFAWKICCVLCLDYIVYLHIKIN